MPKSTEAQANANASARAGAKDAETSDVPMLFQSGVSSSSSDGTSKRKAADISSGGGGHSKEDAAAYDHTINVNIKQVRNLHPHNAFTTCPSSTGVAPQFAALAD